MGSIEPRQKTAKPEMTDAEVWDEAVKTLIGPERPWQAPSVRQRQALELAAAALRFAGEHTMAANLLD